MQSHQSSRRIADSLLIAALLAGPAACDRIAHEPQAESSGSPPVAPVPTKADPRNVMPPGGPYASREDRELTSRVRAALQGADAVDGVDISVSTVSGTVTLSGAVPQQQIARAVQVARAVEGVKDIDNRLLATG